MSQADLGFEKYAKAGGRTMCNRDSFVEQAPQAGLWSRSPVSLLARTASCLALALVVAGCETKNDVLTGERLGIREVLETRYVAEPDQINQSAPISLPAARSNAAWGQSPVSEFARNTHVQLASDLKLAWSAPIGEGDTRRKRLNVDPVFGGGLVYVMDANHLVSAYAPSGQLVWTKDITPSRDDNFQAQGGGFSFADGRLYVASGFGNVMALNAQDGSEIWTQKLGNTATGAPTVYGGVVYVTGGDQLSWALEADNGRVRWQNEGIGADIANVAGAPAPAVDSKFAIFAYGNGSVYSLFRQGGLQKWNADVVGGRSGYTTATISDITGAPVISGNKVYVGNFSGRTVALDSFSGDRLWTAQDGATGQVWPVGNSVFFVSDNFQLLRLNATTGERIWAVDLPGYVPHKRPHRSRDTAYVNFGPILAGGRLIVASSDGILRSFSPTDGSLISEVAIPDGATTRPIVAQGTLYVVSKSGDLLAYR